MLLVLLLFFSGVSLLKAQNNWERFKKTSAPMRKWVLLHPFKAQAALDVSMETQRVADSIKSSPLLDKDPSGGQVDAFRHAYWMARLRQEIGKSAAESLGKVHEKENYKTYEEKKLEDGIVPDEASTIMDLFNNKIGLTFTEKGSDISSKSLIYKIINAIHHGKMKVIKKSEAGLFLTCSGAVIKNKDLIGKWKNDKCLVDSNYKD
ncbi:hypothetical protein BSU00_06950 [Tenacibaculum sp. SG-28]|nr:hypothetical protein BSU00_06950 [Tenacibaculum sp. SG-28]